MDNLRKPTAITVTLLAIFILFTVYKESISRSIQRQYNTLMKRPTNKLRLSQRQWSHNDTPLKKLPICSQQTRISRLQEICQEIVGQYGGGDWQAQSGPNERRFVDHNHRLLLGMTYKCGTTSTKALLLDASGFNVTENVHDHGLMSIHNRSLLKTFNITFADDLEENQVTDVINNYTRMLVVRNPFERLLSTYRGKIVSHDPETKKFRQKIWKMHNPNLNVTEAHSSVPSFVQFVEWIAHNKEKDRHWAPIFNASRPCTLRWDHVLRLETMEHDSQYLLEKLRPDVPYDKMPVRHSHQTEQVSDHDSVMLPEYEDVPQSVMEYFVKLYDVDMKTFGYHWNQSAMTTSCSIEGANGNRCC